MAPQGAEAVATLLELATRETGMLGGCWAAVLEVVSRLDELHAAAAAAAGGHAPPRGIRQGGAWTWNHGTAADRERGCQRCVG